MRTPEGGNRDGGKVRLRRRARLARWTAGVAVVLTLVWVATVRGWGMGLVVRMVVGRAVPEGWTVQVGSVRGDWRSRVTLRDLELTRPGVAVSIPEIEMRYRLTPLLQRTVQAASLDVVEPSVAVDLAAYRGAPPGEEKSAAPEDRPLPDSWDALLEAWGVAGFLGPEPLGRWRVSVGALRVVDARGRVELEGEGGPEVFGVSAGYAAASLDMGPGGTTVGLDSLAGDVMPPADSTAARGGPPPGRFAFAGTLAGGVVTVDRLAYDTPRSRVAGSGSLALLPADRRTDRIDFQLSATPLDLRDVPLELPARIREEPEVALSLAAKGAADSVRIDGAVRGPAALDMDVAMVVRPFRREEGGVAPPPTDGAGASALDATLTITRADLSRWTPPPLDGTLGGRVEVSVSRFASDTPLRASGTLTHQPDSGGPSGLLRRPLRAALRAFRASPEEDVDLEVTVSGAVQVAGNADRAAGRWTEVGSVDARVGRRGATWAARARLDSAAVRGGGSATWAGDTLAVTVRRMTFEHVNARRLDPAWPDTWLSGSAGGRMVGLGSDDRSGTVRLALGPSRFGERSIDTLGLVARVRGRRVEGSVSAAGLGNRMEADYQATFGDGDVRGELTALRVWEFPAEGGADSVPTRSAYGRATGRWLLSAATRQGRLEAELDSAWAGGVWTRDATLTAEVSGEEVSADARLDVQGLATGPVTVEARLDARGRGARELGGAVGFRALRSRDPAPGAADTVVEGGALVDSLVGVVTFEELSRFELEGVFHPAESGRVALRGAGLVTADSTTFALRAHGTLREATAVLRGGTADSVEVVASGRRGAGGPVEVQARVDVSGGRWRDLSVASARADVRWDSTGLDVDTVLVNSNAIAVAGVGMLPAGGGRPGRLEITATVLDLEPVRRAMGAEVLTSGRAGIRLVATGTLDSIDITTSATAEAIVFETLGLTGLEIEGGARLQPPFAEHLGLTTGTLAVALDRLALPEAEVRRVELHMGGRPDSVLVESSALVDDRRRADLTLTLDPRPDRRTASIQRLDVTLDRDAWSLVHPALLSYRDGVSVEAFLLRAGRQEIRVDGGVDGAGALDLRAQVDSSDVGALSDLVGFRGLEGWLGGDVNLSGTRAAPVGRAALTGAFHRAGVAPHAVRMVVEMDGRRVTADVDLEDEGGGLLRLDGSAPLPAAPSADTASLDLALTAQAFGLDWVLPFLDPAVVSGLTGRVDGELTVGGSVDRPTFRGALALGEGGMDIVPLGTRWSQVAGLLRGRGSDLAIDSIRVVSGAGTLTAAGGLSLTEGFPLDFDVTLQRFQAIRNEQYRSTVSGNLRVGGALERPELSGRLFLESLDVFLDERVTGEGFEDVELTDDDLRMLRERFGYVPQDEAAKPPLMDRVTADLVVELSRDSWLRKRQSPEMAVAFTGSVDVRLRPGEEPSLAGSVETIAGRGFVHQFGRRFVLREGTVTFDGPSDSTRLDLSAAYTIPSHDNPDEAEATIVLEITGTQQALTLTLSSDPAMENADIVSYLATGRPASGTLSFGASGSESALVAAGADLAVGRIVGVIEGAAERSVGLDVVEVRRQGLREATLVAGKYVSPRLYVGFAQPITLRDGDFSLSGGGESQVEVELEALRWLLLNVEGTSSAFRIFLRGRRAY